MAVLTSTGITFSDSTTLNSKYGIIPQTTYKAFYQANAPTGWTKLTTQDNKACRVVSGTGGGSGGSVAFTTAFPSSTTPISSSGPISGGIGAVTLSSNSIPSHTHFISINNQGANHANHSVNNGQFNGNVANGPGSNPLRANFAAFANTGPGGSHTHTVNFGNYGNNGSHPHPFSGNASFSTSIDLRVQYVDIIICSLN